MTELFVIAMWAAPVVYAHIAFRGQKGKLAAVLLKFRKAPVPVGFLAIALLGMGVAPFTQAQGMPGAAARRQRC